MKVVIGIATFDNRDIKPTLDSLMGQADAIHIYDNEQEEVDLTDNGKFHALTLYKEPVYFFSCDDDLIYPSDYVKRMIDHIERYNCIVTCHGRVLQGLNKSYYRHHKVYKCLGNELYQGRIDVPGTGCTAFRTDYFNPVGIHLAEEKRKSDILFGLEVAKLDKHIRHVPHAKGWIRHGELDLRRTIAEQDCQNEQTHIKLANQIYTLIYGNTIIEPTPRFSRRVVRRRI